MVQILDRPAARCFFCLALVLIIGGSVTSAIWTVFGNKIDRPPQSPMPSAFELYARRTGARDEAQVIGVSMGNNHRAYILQGFLRPDSHVVNDRLGSVPVTVTYCDLEDCVRIFTAPEQDRLLDISVAGGKQRRMWLRVGGKRYWQDTGLPVDADVKTPFPYTTIKFERTTLREWLKLHPDSDVHAGNIPYPAPENPPFKIAPLLKDYPER